MRWEVRGVQPMTQALLAGFDREVAATRRMLERVPEDRFDWKPHPRSMALGALAAHIANIVGWIPPVIQRDAFDLATAHGEGPTPATRADLLALLDRNASAAHDAIAATDDRSLLQPWTLRRGEHVLFTQPRIAVLQDHFLHHLIHHRGQLSVYLRLNEIPVPGVYGPSADEK